ncbi:MAG: hypothetical protein FJ403_09215 [Verrucomicrobia bacterium]|nr:hypothetical protein [Verrucomicrobiota bacterium]
MNDSTAGSVRLSQNGISWELPREVESLPKRNNDFQPMESGGVRWRVRSAFCNDDLRAILRNPERFMEQNAEILKRDAGATIGRANRFVLKWHHARKPKGDEHRVRRAHERPHLIDLDGLRYLGQMPEERARAGLARLARGSMRLPCVSSIDRARFLIHHCRRRGRRDWRRLWKALVVPAASNQPKDKPDTTNATST